MAILFDETLTPTNADIEAVLAALAANEALAGRDGAYQAYSILLRDEPGGPVVGGLYGYQLFDWMFIQYVAVPPSQKGKGIGTQLMARAEKWARERKLAGLWLDTFAFQARPFYEKLGFTVFGEIADHPRGSSRFFLKKPL